MAVRAIEVGLLRSTHKKTAASAAVKEVNQNTAGKNLSGFVVRLTDSGEDAAVNVNDLASDEVAGF